MSKKLFIAAYILLCMCSSVSFSLSPMGTPTASLEKGQWSIGLDYSKSEIDLKLENIEGSTFFNKDKLEEVKVKNIMARISVGITDNLEIFSGFGIAKAEYKGIASWMDGSLLQTARDGYESDNGLAAEAGVKATVYQNGPVSLGAMLLANWDTLDGTYSETTWTDGTLNGTVEGDLDEDFLTLKIAPGATYELFETINLYGGPFWQWIDGMGHADVQTGSSQDGNADIKQASSFGGLFGLQAEISDSISLNFEVQKTSSSNTFGFSLVSKF